MTYLIHPLEHYQDQTAKSLTPEELALYYQQEKQSINIYINKADYEYIKQYNLNMSRIGYFLIHEFLEKKRKEGIFPPENTFTP